MTRQLPGSLCWRPFSSKLLSVLFSDLAVLIFPTLLFVSPGKQNWYQFYNFYFNIREKLSVIEAIHDFLVWLRTGSNPENIKY